MEKLIENVVKNRLLWKAGEIFRVNDCCIEPYLSELLESVKQIIVSPGYEIIVNDQNVAEICLARSIVAIRSSKNKIHYEEKLVEILQCCLKFPLCSYDGSIPPHAKIASDVLSYFYLNYSELPPLKEFLDTAVKFLLCGNSGIIENLTCFFQLVMENSVRYFSQHIPIILQSILHFDNFSLIQVLVHLHGVDDFRQISRNLNQILISSNRLGIDHVRDSVLKLLSLIYEDDTQVVEDCLRKIIDFLNYPTSVRGTINILNEIFWTNQQIFYYHVTGFMQIGLAATIEDFDLIGSLLVSICSTDETLAKDCLVYLTACLYHKTSNVTIIFAWIESLLHKYHHHHLQVMKEVILHLENENETTEFSVSVIERLKHIVDLCAKQSPSNVESTRELQDLTSMSSHFSSNTSSEFNNDSQISTGNNVNHLEIENNACMSINQSFIGNHSCDDATKVIDQPKENIDPRERISTDFDGNTTVGVDEDNDARSNDPVESDNTENTVDLHLDASFPKTHTAGTINKVRIKEINEIRRDAELEIEFGMPVVVMHEKVENNKSDRNSYFENVGYMSSEASVYDEVCKEQTTTTTILRESTSDEMFATTNVVGEQTSLSNDILEPDKSSSPSKHDEVNVNDGNLFGMSWKDVSLPSKESNDVSLRRESYKANASISMSMSLLGSKSTLSPDNLELYCDAHRQEVSVSMRRVLKRAPIPSDIFINQNNQKCFVEFWCPSEGFKCAFKRKSGFRVETKYICTWLHVMYFKYSMDATSGCQGNLESVRKDHPSLSNDSTNLCGNLVTSCCLKHQEQIKMKKKIRYVWSSVHSLDKKSFVNTVMSGFPSKKDLQKAIKELQENRCFDLLSREEESTEWMCFVCKNKSHSPHFMKSDGSLNINGTLKKKSGYLKFLKPWKFTKFLIDGFNLSYMSQDQPVQLDEITKVKAKEHSMLLSKYTTISLTAIKGRPSPPSGTSIEDCNNGVKKKKLTLRFFDQNEAKTWVRCFYVLMTKFQNVSQNVGMFSE